MSELSATPVKRPLALGLAKAANRFMEYSRDPNNILVQAMPFPPEEGAGLTSGFASLLGIPEAASLLEKLAYGEKLTTGKNQTIGLKPDVLEGAASLAPAVGGLTKGLAKVAGKIPLQLDSSPNILGWHGTTAPPFEQFKPNIRKNEQLGFGIHFADDPEFAKEYALNELVARRKGNNSRLYKAELATSNPLSAASLVQEGSPEFNLAKKLAGKSFFALKDDLGIPTAYLQNAIDATSPARAERLIRDAGYDAIRYNSRLGELSPGATGLTNLRKSPATLVFSPDQIQILEQISLLKGLASGR